MSILYVIGYLGVAGFLLYHVFDNKELIAKLTLRQLYIAISGCLLFPAIFFGPYIIDCDSTPIAAPGWVYYVPYLFLVLAGIYFQYFRPDKAAKAVPILVVLTFLVMVFHNFLPLILSILGRW